MGNGRTCETVVAAVHHAQVENGARATARRRSTVVVVEADADRSEQRVDERDRRLVRGGIKRTPSPRGLRGSPRPTPDRDEANERIPPASDPTTD